MVDCVYAVYNADVKNVRIALPNKLYEAIFCDLPIIVAKNTYLSDLVNEWNVGVAVDHKNPEELRLALSKLMKDQQYYNELRDECKKKRSILIEEFEKGKRDMESKINGC